MADQQVLAVQTWLLNRYGGRTEFSEFVRNSNFRANGNTGNNTMKALRMALQYELGISGPTGNFGPGTLASTPTVSKLSNPTNLQVLKILEGAMWCHGYNPGGAFDPTNLSVISESMNKGLVQFVKDVGLSVTNDIAVIDAQLWKSMLSTDAYTTTWTNGNFQLRLIQKTLNSKVINGYRLAPDYLGGYIPTDGLGGRDFSNLLIYYLQALMDLTPDEAGGNFGPATQESLPIISNGAVREDYLTILKAGLILNNITGVSIDSGWSILQQQVRVFQSQRAIPVTGVVNKSTWMALLVSYGDQNRAPNACDTRFEITDSRANYLISKGIKYVGRYLTGGDFKGLRVGEAQRLKSKGLHVFPIYQGSGDTTDISYYTTLQGKQSALEAVQAAQNFGFPSGTTLYFAVDLDTYGYEIDDIIVPYFRAIKDNISSYKIGVYATRLGCTKVMQAGYATQAFVANMSSGWSGNLGYAMPNNWTFEQYIEHSNLSSSDGLWDLDYCMFSGNGEVHPVDEHVAYDYMQDLIDFAVESGKILNISGITKLKTELVSEEQEVILQRAENYTVKAKVSMGVDLSLGEGPIEIKNGALVGSKSTITSKFTEAGVAISPEINETVDGLYTTISDLAVSIEAGAISFEFKVMDKALATLTITVIDQKKKSGEVALDFKAQYIFEFHGKPGQGEEQELGWEVIGDVAVATVAAFTIVALIASIPATGGASSPGAIPSIAATITLVGDKIATLANNFGTFFQGIGSFFAW